MRKLELSVKRSIFRHDDPEKEHYDEEFSNTRQSILERDRFTCHYCGLQSRKWQEIHHIDDNHANNTPKNLVTVCVLCHACFHIGFSGQKKRGLIIGLNNPEHKIKQSVLNAIVRNLWIGKRSKDTSVSMLCERILEGLVKQVVQTSKLIGTSDPALLGEFLLELPEEKYAKRGDYLKNIFFLPLEEGFKDQVKYWHKTLYKNNSEQWKNTSLSKIKTIIVNRDGADVFSPEKIRELLN